ncbi:MAG: hypothetical protein R3F34_01930 [Planctomycetota bacterium]
MDGALILLFCWLLYMVVSEREQREAEADEGGSTQVESSADPSGASSVDAPRATEPTGN